MKNKKEEKIKTINNLQHFTDIQTVLVSDARRGTYEDFGQVGADMVVLLCFWRLTQNRLLSNQHLVLSCPD